MTRQHIQELNEMDALGQRKILYDSDCIDEHLRTPLFGIDYVNFPLEDINAITDYLMNNASKKIILAQKIVIPWNEENETDISEVEEFILKDPNNTSNHFLFGMI